MAFIPEGWEVSSASIEAAQAQADATWLPTTILSAADYLGCFYEYREATGVTDARLRGDLADEHPEVTILPTRWWEAEDFGNVRRRIVALLVDGVAS